MTALATRSIPDFLKKRDASIHAVLIHGEDGGLVRERSDLLARQVVADLNDPFNFIELSPAELKEEPGRLADECVALSFAGGERVIRVRGQDAGVLASCKILVDGLSSGTVKPNALVLVEAGSLKKTAALRKLFEASKQAAAMPCYEDNPQDIRAMAAEMLGAEEIEISDDAMGLLMETLGEDRGISRAELEKLILYAGPKAVRGGAPARITPEDVRNLLSASGEDNSMALAGLAADGAIPQVAEGLHRAATAGVNPVTILIFMQRHFNRLAAARGFIDDGMAAGAAMKKLRPPVFYAEEAQFSRQLKHWTRARLDRAVTMLLDADFAVKTTGLPQSEIVERTALRLAALGRR